MIKRKYQRTTLDQRQAVIDWYKAKSAIGSSKVVAARIGIAPAQVIALVQNLKRQGHL